MSVVAQNTVLNGVWRIGKLLGEGACAKVYDVECLSEGIVKDKYNPITYDLVAKLIDLPTGKKTSKKYKDQNRLCNTLNYEKDLLNGPLSDFPMRARTPKIQAYFGEANDIRYMMMEKMDCDLAAFAQKEIPSRKIIGEIGLQLLQGLEVLHNKGYCFVDVKPGNFMMSGPDVKFIDFGCLERWKSFTSTGSRPNVPRELVGTPEFGSVRCHNNNINGRIDDIESMCLVLLSLVSGGSLPWRSSKSLEDTKKAIERADIKKMGKERGMPEVAEILLACRKADTDDTPLYKNYESILKKMVSSSGNPPGMLAMYMGNGQGSSKAKSRSPPKKTSAKATVSSRGKRKISDGSDDDMNIDNEEDDDDEEEEEEEARPAPKRSKNTSSAASKKGKKAPASPKAGKGKGRGAKEEDGDGDLEETGICVEVFDLVKKKKKGVLHSLLSKKSASVVGKRGRGKNKDAEEFSVGKTNECDLLLDDEYVSHSHLVLKVSYGYSGKTYSFMDDGSFNGTRLNGRRIQQNQWYPVVEGEDVIKLGKTELVLHST